MPIAVFTSNGGLKSCKTHDKDNVKQRPVNKCPVCLCLWLQRKLATTIYEEDMDDLLHFANTADTKEIITRKKLKEET
jgi:hypothetical protein